MGKTAAKNSSRTGIDLSEEKIVQVSLVVNDAEKVARRFSDLFGISWNLYDLRLGKIILHDKPVTAADSLVRVALGDFGGRSLKLIQPVSGRSSYQEFLQKNGEGFYTVGFGALLNYSQALNTLKNAGVAVEMQGAGFSILDTTEELGCRIELSEPEGGIAVSQTGAIRPDDFSLVDMEKPIFTGGKRINQIGIVLKDEKKAAKGFEELLGIRGWTYAYGPPNLTNAFMDEKPVPENAMESLDVAFAMGRLGDIQIELIRPIGIRPGGCHQRFLDAHGNGLQHVSFGVQEDYQEFVKSMKNAGIGAEFSATIRDHGVSATYFATQKELGGFQLEIVGKVV